MKYKIVSGYLVTIEDKVNGSLEAGWKLCGGVCSERSLDGHTIMLYQAMTYEEKEMK
jgi:hypothetical protein